MRHAFLAAAALVALALTADTASAQRRGWYSGYGSGVYVRPAYGGFYSPGYSSWGYPGYAYPRSGISVSVGFGSGYSAWGSPYWGSPGWGSPYWASPYRGYGGWSYPGYRYGNYYGSPRSYGYPGYYWRW